MNYSDFLARKLDMGAANGFRLWRFDVARVKIEREIPKLFRPGITVGEIAKFPPDDRLRSAEQRLGCDSIGVRRVELELALRLRTRLAARSLVDG